jgi:hypothetical protein
MSRERSRLLSLCPHLHTSGGNSQLKTSGTLVSRSSGGAGGSLSTALRSTRGIWLTQTEIARRVGISTYQVRTWRHRREERLSIDVKAPIKVSSIPTLLTCSIEGLPESMMASNSMKRSERSGFLEVFAWCATSCSPCVRTVVLVHSSRLCLLLRLNSSRPAMRFGSLFEIESGFTDQEQEQLALIRAASAPAETVYGLVQDFLTMVHQREGERLDAWIEAAQASQIPELQHFVNGILKDKDAVVAGLTLAGSQWACGGASPEARNLVKRAMFGRAKLPLLRQRLLNAV